MGDWGLGLSADLDSCESPVAFLLRDCLGLPERVALVGCHWSSDGVDWEGARLKVEGRPVAAERWAVAITVAWGRERRLMRKTRVDVRGRTVGTVTVTSVSAAGWLLAPAHVGPAHELQGKLGVVFKTLHAAATASHSQTNQAKPPLICCPYSPVSRTVPASAVTVKKSAAAAAPPLRARLPHGRTGRRNCNRQRSWVRFVPVHSQRSNEFVACGEGDKGVFGVLGVLVAHDDDVGAGEALGGGGGGGG